MWLTRPGKKPALQPVLEKHLHAGFGASPDQIICPQGVTLIDADFGATGYVSKSLVRKHGQLSDLNAEMILVGETADQLVCADGRFHLTEVQHELNLCVDLKKS